MWSKPDNSILHSTWINSCTCFLEYVNLLTLSKATIRTTCCSCFTNSKEKSNSFYSFKHTQAYRSRFFEGLDLNPDQYLGIGRATGSMPEL